MFTDPAEIWELWTKAASALAGDQVNTAVFHGLPLIGNSEPEAVAAGRGFFDQIALFSSLDAEAVEKLRPKENASVIQMYHALLSALQPLAFQNDTGGQLRGAEVNIVQTQRLLNSFAAAIVAGEEDIELPSFDIRSYAIILRLFSDIVPGFRDNIPHMRHLISDAFQAFAASDENPTHHFFAKRLNNMRAFPEFILLPLANKQWGELIRQFTPHMKPPQQEEIEKFLISKTGTQSEMKALEQLTRENKAQLHERHKRRKKGNKLSKKKKRALNAQINVLGNKISALRAIVNKKQAPVAEKIRAAIATEALLKLPVYTRTALFEDASKIVTQQEATRLFNMLYATNAERRVLFRRTAQQMTRRLQGIPLHERYPRQDENGARLDSSRLASYIAQSQSGVLADLPFQAVETTPLKAATDMAVQILVCLPWVRRRPLSQELVLADRVNALFLAVTEVCAQLSRAGVSTEVLAYSHNDMTKKKKLWLAKNMSSDFGLKEKRGLAILLQRASEESDGAYISPVDLALDCLKKFPALQKIHIAIQMNDYVFANISAEDALMDYTKIERSFNDGGRSFKLDFGGPTTGSFVRHTTPDRLAETLCALIAPPLVLRPQAAVVQGEEPSLG